MLAIERKVLPEGHADQLGSLDRLAALTSGMGTSPAPSECDANVGDRAAGLPENDWRVTDARLALADAEKLASMSPSQRAPVAEATRLDDESSKMYTAGRFAEAVGPARRALVIREAILGPEHRLTATLSATWGSCCYPKVTSPRRGHYSSAGLAIREAKLGKDHPDIAAPLNNLGCLSRIQGDYTGARPLLERALAICEAKRGKGHPETARFLFSLANLYYVQGNYSEARPRYERVVAILRQNWARITPISRCACRTWHLCFMSRETTLAPGRSMSGRLAICESRHGKDHPNTATSLNGLAELLSAQSDFADARGCMSCAWRSSRRSWAKTTPRPSPTPSTTSRVCAGSPG